ncbi:MAG: hypothetical protein GWN72_05270 [Nitrospinaceae bacterium]|nr:hypothetical protein [Nitrospinaceae bacterium]NIU95795.1 hypothetical protein [Nitrospinaceae bacterium]NIW58443.1 hypothetical protein [Nitrospinaceae bacterium]
MSQGIGTDAQNRTDHVVADFFIGIRCDFPFFHGSISFRKDESWKRESREKGMMGPEIHEIPDEKLRMTLLMMSDNPGRFYFFPGGRGRDLISLI